MKSFYFFLIALFFHYGGQMFPQHSYNCCEGTHKNAYTTVEAPSIFTHKLLLGKTATSNFEISYSDTTPLPPIAARNAIDYSINIWAHLVNTSISQTIKVHIIWSDLGWSSTGSYTLAKCKPTSFYNSPALPNQNVQYPIALAEYLLNQNLNGSNSEIEVIINSNDSVKWYFGTDGIPQTNKVDFVTTVLHEIAHGLGYNTAFSVDGNLGIKGIGGYPVDTNLHYTRYDMFGAIGSYYPNGDLLINYPDKSFILKEKLTSKNVFFNGENAWVQNGRHLLPKLYAPLVWEQGSSFSHLDESTYPAGNSNSLMTPTQNNAEVIHSPGEVGLAV